MHEGGCLHVQHPSYPTAYPHIMAAPASAPPLAVIPYTGDEITVKVTVRHEYLNGQKPYFQFRRGRFRNPTLKDIETWLKNLNMHLPCLDYTDEEGDNIGIRTEQDWDECVHVWRHSGKNVLKFTLVTR